MLSSNEREKLFHIMDSDGDTELCFAEFVSSIAAIKKTETRCFEDPGFSERAFPVGTRVRLTEISKNDSRAWEETLEALDAAALKETWKQILNLLDTTFARETFDESARAFLQTVDVDQSGEVDSEELSGGFQALGLSLNDRQLRVFRGDISGDSNKALTLDEFISRVRVERKKIEANKNEAIKRQAADLLKRSNSILSSLGDEVSDFAISGCDSRRTLEQVVSMCAERVASRLMLEAKQSSGLASTAKEIDDLAQMFRNILRSEICWYNPKMESQFTERLTHDETEPVAETENDGPPEKERRKGRKVHFQITESAHSMKNDAFGNPRRRTVISQSKTANPRRASSPIGSRF